MIGIYNYTTAFTFCGTLSGLIGIINACEGNIEIALLCLLLSGFFDMFDGTIARTKKGRTTYDQKYGVQLDSLSDVVCFSVLPTVLALKITSPLGIGSALCIIYLITSISRLAYFNVEEEMRSQKESGARQKYTGLPVTTAALILPVLYLLKNIASSYFPLIFLLGILITALFQISKIQLPHLKWKGLITCLIVGIIILTIYLLNR